MPRIRRRPLLKTMAVLGGAALSVIGLRFLFVPESASRFFGIDPPPGARPLLHVIALRDIWLGLLLIGLAAMSQWREMAVWLGLATLVCLGDAWIAATASGRPTAIAFHVCSGLAAAALAVACALEAGKQPTRPTGQPRGM
jgi:hypothetical protein